jgi:hypothetical protein
LATSIIGEEANDDDADQQTAGESLGAEEAGDGRETQPPPKLMWAVSALPTCNCKKIRP